jgi:hypothetical protein
LYIHVPYENWRFPIWLKSHLSLAPPFINTMYVTTWPILSVKGGTSERCYRTRRGRTYKNEWPISWNYEYIIFGQIIFQNFHQFKAFVGLSDYRTVGLSDCRTIGLSDYSYDPKYSNQAEVFWIKWVAFIFVYWFYITYKPNVGQYTRVKNCIIYLFINRQKQIRCRFYIFVYNIIFATSFTIFLPS